MITSILEEKLSEVLDQLGYDKECKVILSNRPDLCDYQFDGVFKLAKILHTSPIEIGEKISFALNQIPDFNQYFSKVEFVKPGFVNMTLSDCLINQCLNLMLTSENFHFKKVEHPQTYVIDYGGPNIAKPLHVGHMRPAIVGESIKRIISYVGHHVISDVHFGDFGLQIGQVIYGMKMRGIHVDDVTLDDLNEIYPAMSKLCKEDESIKEICATITKDLQDGNVEYETYYEKIFELSSNDIKDIYRYLDVDFDLWYGEMSSRKYIPFVEKVLNDKNISYISEGALVVDVKEDGDAKEMPPLIFKKSNGAYLYGSTDMATIYQREQDYHPDYILYVADARQSLHFNQVFRASLKSGITDASLEHLGFGTINGVDGKPYKTRSGETPKLRMLFDEVKDIFVASKEQNKDMSDEDLRKIVNSILKFADLQNNREKDYIFDIKKFSEVVGKTGPYVLYTALRISKILETENTLSDIKGNIYNIQDRNLRLKLLEAQDVIYNAYLTRLPSVIANYVYDLCVLLNAFYQNNHINGLEDDRKKNDWLCVLKLSYNILTDLLDLLGIQVPSVM
jgi:arginyl-tRNA synthetase